MRKRYMLRDSTGFYFQSMSSDGMEARFTSFEDHARQFTRQEMDDFRRNYSFIKGRVVLVKDEADTASGRAQRTNNDEGD